MLEIKAIFSESVTREDTQEYLYLYNIEDHPN
jgi:hypothetical protein